MRFLILGRSVGKDKKLKKEKKYGTKRPSRDPIIAEPGNDKTWLQSQHGDNQEEGKVLSAKKKDEPAKLHTNLPAVPPQTSSVF